jgi:hypothetical protein
MRPPLTIATAQISGTTCDVSTQRSSTLRLLPPSVHPIPLHLALQFVATQSANEIAICLRKDEGLIDAAEPCS